MSGKGGLDASQSRRAALRYATAFLDAAGIAGAEGDARFLLLGLLGLAPRDLALDGDRPIGGAAIALSDALTRRASGEPVARILGAWEFWGLPFTLVPDTLVPRPDTETVVETALAALPDRRAPLRILDLGTGSGCILVALLSELPNAVGIGLDRSEAALRPPAPMPAPTASASGCRSCRAIGAMPCAAPSISWFRTRPISKPASSPGSTGRSPSTILAPPSMAGRMVSMPIARS